MSFWRWSRFIAVGARPLAAAAASLAVSTPIAGHAIGCRRQSRWSACVGSGASSSNDKLDLGKSGSQRDLIDTLMLNSYVSRPLLDEIAAVMDFDKWDSRVASGSTSNSSRKWQRTMKREVQMPSLYFAKLKMASGTRLHPFRLPSVKARELWHKDKARCVNV